MKALKEKILAEGKVIQGNVLKVDSFLNHQMDIDFLNEVGKEFKRRFQDQKITKILTIESSGIGIACIAAQYFGCPVVFAKKNQSLNLDSDCYRTNVESFTNKCVYHVMVSKKYLSKDDHILILDDFLANGNALLGLMEIVKKSGATLEGIGVVVEKATQIGGSIIRSKGVHLESLAIIESMNENGIRFKED